MFLLTLPNLLRKSWRSGWKLSIGLVLMGYLRGRMSKGCQPCPENSGIK